MSFFRLLSLVLCLALLSVFAPAETSAALKSDATAKQKVQAENRKASVDEKLSELEKKLSAREAENEAAENDLKKADQSISEANRRLRTLKRNAVLSSSGSPNSDKTVAAWSETSEKPAAATSRSCVRNMYTPSDIVAVAH